MRRPLNRFYFNGVSSRIYNIVLDRPPVYNAPKRDVTSLKVPGRNGALTLDNGRFENIPVAFPVSIVRDFSQNADSARQWLCAAPGYRRLEDSYHPEEYRMARYINGLEIDVLLENKAGKATIIFDCMPQRFLKRGETAVSFSSPGSLYNPTQFDALPRISVYGTGSGSLVVNGNTVQFSSLQRGVVLDCEIMRAVDGTGAAIDSTITGTFSSLTLVPGENTISYSGGINSVKIIPRWWTV